MSDGTIKLLRDWLETHSQSDESRQYLNLFSWNVRDILERIEGAEAREKALQAYVRGLQRDVTSPWHLREKLAWAEARVTELEAEHGPERGCVQQRMRFCKRIQQLESALRPFVINHSLQVLPVTQVQAWQDEARQALSSKVAETRAIEPNAADKSEKSEESSEGTRTGITPPKIGKFVPNGYSSEGASALHNNSYADLLAALMKFQEYFYCDGETPEKADAKELRFNEFIEMLQAIIPKPEPPYQEPMFPDQPFLAQPSARQPAFKDGEAEKYAVGTRVASRADFATLVITGVVTPNFKLPDDICIEWESGQRCSYDKGWLDRHCEVVKPSSRQPGDEPEGEKS